MNKLSQQLRQCGFYGGIFLLICIYFIIGFCDYTRDCHNSLVVYIIEIVALMICDIFYTWWWIHNHRASPIYKWMTILLYCLTFESAMELYARSLYLSDFNSFQHFVGMPWWYGRTVPKIFSLIYMISLIIGRIIGSKFSDQVEK